MKNHILSILFLMAFYTVCFAEDTNEVMAKFSFSNNSKEFLSAADLNNPAHIFEIGQMYYRGDGVAQNSSLALMWYIISEHMGADASNQIEVTAASMAPDQILKARDLAENWINTKLN